MNYKLNPDFVISKYNTRKSMDKIIISAFKKCFAESKMMQLLLYQVDIHINDDQKISYHIDEGKNQWDNDAIGGNKVKISMSRIKLCLE